LNGGTSPESDTLDQVMACVATMEAAHGELLTAVAALEAEHKELMEIKAKARKLFD